MADQARPADRSTGFFFSDRRRWRKMPVCGRHRGLAMDMKRINSGKLRAIGYDARARTLRVELDDGSLLEYSGVGDEVWRRLSSSGAAWSYYRDNIEEEFTCRRAGKSSGSKANPLDDLFKS
jgi:hypothetical protein